MLGESDFSATGLIDNVNLEQDDARRNALADSNWDPEGLYRLEQERDEALDELLRNLPEGTDIEFSLTSGHGTPGAILHGRRRSAHCTIFLRGKDGGCAKVILGSGQTPAEVVVNSLREFRAWQMAGRVAAEVVA